MVAGNELFGVRTVLWTAGVSAWWAIGRLLKSKSVLEAIGTQVSSTDLLCSANSGVKFDTRERIMFPFFPIQFLENHVLKGT